MRQRRRQCGRWRRELYAHLPLCVQADTLVRQRMPSPVDDHGALDGVLWPVARGSAELDRAAGCAAAGRDLVSCCWASRGVRPGRCIAWWEAHPRPVDTVHAPHLDLNRPAPKRAKGGSRSVATLDYARAGAHERRSHTKRANSLGRKARTVSRRSCKWGRKRGEWGRERPWGSGGGKNGAACLPPCRLVLGFRLPQDGSVFGGAVIGT